ncbi:MAG: hypothetical protein WC835_03265 [Candidatus Paceibacterota bacterium]|jgi:hypothetical protein
MPKYCIVYVREKRGKTHFDKKEILRDSPIDTMEDIGMVEREISSDLCGANITIIGCIPLAGE